MLAAHPPTLVQQTADELPRLASFTTSLQGGSLLSVDRVVNADVLSVSSPTGELRLRIHIKGDAVCIESIDGRNVLSIRGPLVLQAESLELSASRHLALNSGGSLSIQASGPLIVGAESIELTAIRGDVDIIANDDVKMEAERIRMNA